VRFRYRSKPPSANVLWRIESLLPLFSSLERYDLTIGG
jgi:hypothetical protein